MVKCWKCGEEVTVTTVETSGSLKEDGFEINKRVVKCLCGAILTVTNSIDKTKEEIRCL